MRRVESKIRFEVPTTEEIPSSFEQWRGRANVCGNPKHDLDYSRIFRKFVETTKGGTRKPHGKISERSATTELRKQVGEERARIEGSIFDVRSETAADGLGSAISTRVPFSRQVATVD